MRRLIIALTVLGAWVVFLAGCGGGRSKQQTDWREFTSKDGKFSVYMPTDPIQRVQTEQTSAGPVRVHVYSSEFPLVSYIVMHHEAGTGDPQAILDEKQERIVSSLRGNLKSKKEISLGGHPGRELEIKTPDEIIYTTRLYVVGDRLYEVTVKVPEGFNVNKNMRRFMNSFKLM